MATGAEVFNMLMQGAASGRTRREEGYTNRRRAVEDPYKDRALARTDNARNAIVDMYGVAAGDPEAYSVAQGTDESVQKLPGELKLQDRQITMNDQSIAATDREVEEAAFTKKVGAVKNFITGAEQIAERGGDIGAYMSSIPASVKAEMDWDEEDDAWLAETFATGGVEGLRAARAALGDPDKVKELIELQGSDPARAEYATVSEGGVIRRTGENVYANPLDDEAKRAEIALRRAQADKARTAAGADEEGGTGPVSELFDRAWGAITAAAEGGAYPSSGDQDFIRRTFRGFMASPVGRGVATVGGTEGEELRDNVDAATSALRMLFIENPNITSRMFDTPAEQRALMKQLEGGSSLESKVEALKWTEARFGERFPDGTPQGGSSTRTGQTAPSGTQDVVVSFEDFMKEE